MSGKGSKIIEGIISVLFKSVAIVLFSILKVLESIISGINNNLKKHIEK